MLVTIVTKGWSTNTVEYNKLGSVTYNKDNDTYNINFKEISSIELHKLEDDIRNILDLVLCGELYISKIFVSKGEVISIKTREEI